MIDNSSVSAFQKCPMSYYLQYIKELKKREIDDTNAAMVFGNCFHKFVEHSLKGLDFDFILETEELPDDIPQYSRQALRIFCNAYQDKYHMIDKEFELLNCEDVFEFDLGGKKFKVKCDTVVKHKNNIYGLELKTTKSISYNYFNKFFLNSQISAQCYGIKEKYGQCSGIILRAGETKQLKRKPYGAYDAIEKFDDNCWLACKFNSEPINRNNHELEGWKENTLRWIDLIEDSCYNSIFPKATGSWGGIICSSCEYKELCKVSQGLDLDEDIIDSLYEKYNSTEYLEEVQNGIKRG